MKGKGKRIGLAVMAGAVALAAALVSSQLVSAGSDVVRASATLGGAPGSGISGEVAFTQSGDDAPEPGVHVVAKVKGLAPGKHGLHIHETGTCDPPGFTSAGGHFDPGPNGHSTPVDQNHPFHMGDLPNLVVTGGGAGHLNAETSRVTLSPGPISVMDMNGSAVIVHANEDLGQPGVVGASGGPRLACGVISAGG